MTFSTSNPTSTHTGTAAEPGGRRPVFGLPLLAIIGLALLGAPRVVLHDLGVIHEGTAINMVFVTVPIIIWVVTVLWCNVRNPFLTMLAICAIYGIILAAIHQILWTVAYAGSPPRLGGNLADLDPVAQDIIVRVFAAGSGIITGLVLGAGLGLITWGVSALLRRARKSVSQ